MYEPDTVGESGVTGTESRLIAGLVWLPGSARSRQPPPSNVTIQKPIHLLGEG